MPRTKKPAGRAVDKRNGRKTELSKVAGARFDPPDDLCDQAVQQWDAYWGDPVASAQTKADRNLLERWICNVDRYWRLIRQADESPMTRNSQGQVANPLYAVALKVESSVKADEAQLGIGPKNRAALGIAVISEQKSLAEMNSSYGGGGGGEHADADQAEAEGQEEPDPRLKVVEGEVV